MDSRIIPLCNFNFIQALFHFIPQYDKTNILNKAFSIRFQCFDGPVICGSTSKKSI